MAFKIFFQTLQQKNDTVHSKTRCRFFYSVIDYKVLIEIPIAKAFLSNFRRCLRQFFARFLSLVITIERNLYSGLTTIFLKSLEILITLNQAGAIFSHNIRRLILKLL